MSHAADLVGRFGSLLPSCGPTSVVAIDGRAGSGKSTLAADLAAAARCPVVALEYLYPGWDGLSAGVDLLVREVLAPLSRGHIALVPAYDWSRGGWGPPWSLEGPPLLVVEGVGAASAPARSHLSLSVWLECGDAARRRRALGREADGAAFAAQWDRWARQEEALLASDPIPELVDLVLSTDG